MAFAEVILPLPLDGTFTYAVPADMAGTVREGVRVVVPFGKSKSYVGVVLRCHDDAPLGFEVKAISEVLDGGEPVLLPVQLKLWQWMSEYYMSPIGEVYKAALPAGLKAEDGYKPRTETHVRLAQKYQSEQALHIAIDMLGRAPRQQQAFIAFLQLSGWDMIAEARGEGYEVRGVTREELMNESGAALATLSQLVKRGMIEMYEVEVGRLNVGGEPHPENIKQLSAPQTTAFNEILLSMLRHQVTLLHGVTSSGKTELYIHLIQREIEQHRQVLYLLPEIALTVQMMERLRRVFGSRLGIYHSKYSDAERVEIWQKQLSGNPYDVILGARSAVFLPFQRLGLVIVDEEHETSYKQQDPMPRYHARSAAIMLSAFSKEATLPSVATATFKRSAKEATLPSVATPLFKRSEAFTPKVLLGSATPSLETWHNAHTGKYGLVSLTERYQGIELPEIQVVDTGDLRRRRMMCGPLSPLLLAKVREALESGEQAILFQNRRGWAPQVMCQQCRWVPRCEACDVALTLHRSMGCLTCHYCGRSYPIPTECPACGEKHLRGIGYGTEKIEDKLRELLPEARIARMDLDTTHTRQAYERLISDFASGRTNLLVGTQMISKGLDFDRVSVVGILDADAMLGYPDFRAYEHAFMMMMQVSGRAGRKHKRGLVLLQTAQPTDEVIQQVVRGDLQGFYDDLSEERRLFHYPPFYRLIYIYLKHQKDSVADTAALELGARLRHLFGERVLGPDKPTVARVKNLCIRKLVVKLEPQLPLPQVRQCLNEAQRQIMPNKQYAALQVYYDVDPM